MKKLVRISNYAPLLILIVIFSIQAFLDKVLSINVEKVFQVLYLLYFFLCLLYVFNKQAEKLSKIKEKVNEYQDDISEIKETLNKKSFKLNISIVPNWHEIINIIAEQDITQFEKYFKEIKNDIELNIEDDKSLYGKSFNFSYFYNGISKMEQIWSENYHTFVDDIEIQGNIYYSIHNLKCLSLDKYKFNKIVKNLMIDCYIIRPDYIGIRNDIFILDNNKLSKIPFWEIIDFLLELDKNNCYQMRKIKVFPYDLSKLMELNGVNYDVSEIPNPYGTDEKEVLIDLESDWVKKNGIQIFNRIIDSHVFKTKYYTLYLKMNIFE